MSRWEVVRGAGGALVTRPLRRTLRRLRAEWRSRLIVDAGDRSKTVFLAGTARSGSSWVQDIIAHGHQYRVMFEPFHALFVPEVSGWNYRQYIRSSDRDPRFVGPASAVLSGQIRNPWVDQYNRRRVAEKRVIKEVRGQLFLHWLRQTFPEVPVVLLVRHPCAVASSRLQLGWPDHLDELLVQKDLMADFLGPFADEIAGCDDAFERQIWMWCVENYVPLMQFRQGEILVAFYEDLCREPRREIARILAFVGDGASPDALALAARPSASSRKGSAIRAGTDRVSSWRRHVGDRQVETAAQICARFGLDALYDEGDLPLLRGGQVLTALHSSSAEAAS